MWLVWSFLCLAAFDGPTAKVVGRVVDAGGMPVVGAVVVLAGPRETERSPTVAQGETDAEGRFTLERPASLAGEDEPTCGPAWNVARRFSPTIPLRRSSLACFPAVERVLDLAGRGKFGGLPLHDPDRHPLKALAAYDPSVLSDLIDRLPKSAHVVPERESAWGVHGFDQQLRLAGAEMLALPPEARVRAALIPPLARWPVRGNGRYPHTFP